jgi:predicted DsbA family dithiol-disulfide isomerase
VSVKITYYLEVTSSWCYWAEPAWAELKQRCASKPVEFGWKIALLDESGLPKSRAQADWFYRRSGTIMRSPFMLNSGWFEAGLKEYPAPNFIADAAKDFGVTDDRVRLAIAEAALRHGQKVTQWEVSAAVAAKAAGLDVKTLLARARSPEIENRSRATTAEFHALQVTQRPAFLIENAIGDRAVFSGIVRAEPLAAAIDAMLADEAAYASWKAHFGDVPPN